MTSPGWEWIADNDAALRATAVRLRPDEAYDGEDALHDAYIYVVERLDPAGNPRSYIMAKARLLIIDYWRKHEQRQTELVDTMSSRGVDDEAIASVLFEQTCCAIQALPPLQQLVMWRRMAGYSQSEIASLIGEPLGTVKARQRAALKGLAA